MNADTWTLLDPTAVYVLSLSQTLDNPDVALPGYVQSDTYDTAVLEAAMAVSKARSLAP